MRDVENSSPVPFCWYCSKLLVRPWTHRGPQFVVVNQHGHPHRVHRSCAVRDGAPFITPDGEVGVPSPPCLYTCRVCGVTVHGNGQDLCPYCQDLVDLQVEWEHSRGGLIW